MTWGFGESEKIGSDFTEPPQESKKEALWQRLFLLAFKNPWGNVHDKAGEHLDAEEKSKIGCGLAVERARARLVDKEEKFWIFHRESRDKLYEPQNNNEP